VTDGTNVDVRLVALELCLCHKFLLETFTEDFFRLRGSQTNFT